MAPTPRLGCRAGRRSRSGSPSAQWRGCSFPVDDLAVELEAAGLTSVAVRRHLRDVTYRADQYLEVLDTYSGNRVLDPAIRTGLFERIGARIEARPSQEVRKTYRATLTAGKSQAPT